MWSRRHEIGKKSLTIRERKGRRMGRNGKGGGGSEEGTKDKGKITGQQGEEGEKPKHNQKAESGKLRTEDDVNKR